jgi:hypothetical protein
LPLGHISNNQYAEGLGWLAHTQTAPIFGHRRMARTSAPRAIHVDSSVSLLARMCVDAPTVLNICFKMLKNLKTILDVRSDISLPHINFTKK